LFVLLSRSREIREKYGEGKVFTSEGVIGHIITRDNSLHVPDAYRRTVLDNELLSRCDELIITAGSTYGMIAALRSGRMPLFFSGMRGARQCERMSLGHRLPTTPRYNTAVI
jgi:hypothetical protein